MLQLQSFCQHISHIEHILKYTHAHMHAAVYIHIETHTHAHAVVHIKHILKSYSYTISTVDSLDAGIHRHGESEASEHEKLGILSLHEDLSELEGDAWCALVILH